MGRLFDQAVSLLIKCHILHLMNIDDGPVSRKSNTLMTLWNCLYEIPKKPYNNSFKKKRNEIIDCSVADLVGQETFDVILKPQYDRCIAGEEVAFQILDVA